MNRVHSQMMCFSEYGRTLRIWESNNGRRSGWVIEGNGEPVAVLSDYRWEEMFWDSYRVEIVAPDPELRNRLRSREFWAGEEPLRFVWRNRKFDGIAKYPLPAGPPFGEPDRVLVRGLYLITSAPRPWDWLVLWIRRFLPKRTT